MAEVKSCVETKFRNVCIVNKINSFKPWRSGHWYFDLKDAKATLPAVMFKGHTIKMRFNIQDGQKVYVQGRAF